MAEIIRTWLRSRLGVIIDLTPEVFGHYCRDGTFLAKLLHSYDIINDSQLNTIIPTSDPALARVNLRHLRVWLKFIGITCDDKIIQDISNGKGTASLRLFYKVFLCLENKDRLHFITLEKEREKYIPTSTKFDVKVVAEDDSLDELPKHPLFTLLEDNANNIEWYKKKFQQISNDFRQERENFRQSQQSKESLQPSSSSSKKLNPVLNKEINKKNSLEELDTFARKNGVTSSKRRKLIESDQLKKNNDHSHLQGDSEAAKEFMNILKKRKQQAIETQSFKIQMQKMLLSQVWEKIENDQEKEFDKILAGKVLRQSQYEKQMVRKLCDIRSEKRRLAANRQLVDELMQKTRENHIKMVQENERQIKLGENEEVDDECRRLNELHERMGTKNSKIIKKQNYQNACDIVNDIIEIAIKAGEIKLINNNVIPEYMRNEWKILFLNDVPIIEPLKNESPFQDAEEPLEEIVINNQSKKEDILSDNDFQNYHNLKSPWNEFLPDLDEKAEEFLYLGIMVLGYIVHKLLKKSMDSYSSTHLRPKLPDVKVRAVVLGIPDQSFYSQMQGLLKHKKIKLVLVKDAINYCLLRYKEEMKDHEYIDSSIKVDKSSKNSQQLIVKNKSNDSEDQNKNIERLSLETKINTDDNEEFYNKHFQNKQIQTPKNIPYDDMDPVLTDTAYIGKWIHEFFVLGEPISDELTTKAIFEYLKSFKDVHGWVLINYPNTYQQMISLECLLSGNKWSKVFESTQIDCSNAKNDVLIDKINSSSSRITFQCEKVDSVESFIESKLVPNPLINNDNLIMVSYLTAFIRMLTKPKEDDIHPEELFEILPEDSTTLDEFYKDQGLASIVYYTFCDSSTIKKVARLIIGETSVPRKSSVELFGQVSKTLENIEKKSVVSIKQSFQSASEEIKSEIRKPKPGEPEWSWIDLCIPIEISKALASVWKNLENVYIDGLKNSFLQKRINFVAIIPYKEFVVQIMVKFLNQPDDKQKLIENFQEGFNEIPVDARVDDDVKNELYRRLDQFQTKLWDICDLKRREAQEEKKKIIFDHWTSIQLVDLINIYLMLIQLEMDRFIDTLKLIHSYYLSILQCPLQDENFSKILLNKLTLDTENSGVDENSSSNVLKESDFKNEIAELLLNSDEVSIDFKQLFCYNTIESTIKLVNAIIDDMFGFLTASLKNENNLILFRRSSDRKGKRKTSKKISISSSSKEDITLMTKKYQDLFLEWEYAAMYEINRIRMRIKILETSAKSDIDYLLKNMQRVFVSVNEMINEKYENEIKNINDVTNIFCLAIEKEKSMEKIITFGSDNLDILEHILIDSNERQSLIINENLDDLKFSLGQLERLKDILQQAAPSGLITERSFVYILQDLIACKDLDQVALLPPSWYDLKSQDVIEIVRELFDNEEYIDWRDFIISLIDIPMPDQDELLDAREAFREKDLKFIGVIFKQDFLSTPIWFCKFFQFSSTKPSLNDNFQLDEEEFFKEELGKENEEKIDSSMNLIKSQKNSTCTVSSKEKINSEHEILNNDENVKLSLVKQLLCDMYLVNDYSVNYVAMLWSFCKDDNPSYGLGKAISLSLGGKICLDFNEGENYVNKLLEEKKLSNDMREYLKHETFQFFENLMETVIDQVMENYELRLVEIQNSSLFNIDDSIKNKKQIVIEKLDALEETIDSSNHLTEKTQLPSSDDSDKKVSNNVSEKNISLSKDVIINEETFLQKRKIIYWIPIQIFESVLLSVITPNVSQSQQFYAKSLSEHLQSIYREIQCKEINDKSNVVLAHRLLHHKWIKQILQLTGRFTHKNSINFVAKLLRKHQKSTND